MHTFNPVDAKSSILLLLCTRRSTHVHVVGLLAVAHPDRPGLVLDAVRDIPDRALGVLPDKHVVPPVRAVSDGILDKFILVEVVTLGREELLGPLLGGRVREVRAGGVVRQVVVEVDDVPIDGIDADVELVRLRRTGVGRLPVVDVVVANRRLSFSLIRTTSCS
jgi:hypothetical protein